MGKVVLFSGITKLDLPAERILEMAIEADLEGVVIMGYTKNGELYAVSSYADGGTLLWLMEMTKKKMFDATEEYVNG